MVPSRVARPKLNCQRRRRRRCLDLVVGGLLLIAVASADDLPAIRSIQVEPTDIELNGTNRQQRLLVTAKLANERLVDVTHLALAESSDPRVVRVEDGLAVGVADGEAHLRVTCDGLETFEPGRVRDQHLGEIGNDSPVVCAIDIGQSAPRNTSPKPRVIEQSLNSTETGFDVAHALAKPELPECQRQKLIATRESARPLFSIVASHARVELVSW